MATLILTAVGQALGAGAGGLFGLGGAGAILGKAVGALAGSSLDQSLFGASRTVEAGRLNDLSVQSSSEGASLPKLYGRMRLAGQIIWATRFEEEVNEERQGGKGGGGSVTVKSYAYFGNFAVALCEGPINRIGRVWADGKPLDMTGISWRLYHGDETQAPDPLIEAHQGEAPAYRGTAYVVFEHLALESFGNRLPQLTFEVIRSVEPLENQIRAVTLIPSAGEFIYQPTKVSETPSPGSTRSVNRHTGRGLTDWQVSLDELMDLCPNLESVALVVSWFGDDLRAGHCTARPKVEFNSKTTTGATWSVSGLARGDATLVSRIDGNPAYGGTPSDASVMAAIADLKARGLKVMLYPFLLMDVPTDNVLPDPYGGSTQAPYPWRGRIVPAEDATSEASAFFGTATAGQFAAAGETIGFSGGEDWGYRRFILHMAHLVEAAGGVDAFLIGSELRGLTQAQAAPGVYPFVAGLKTLAEDVRGVLSPETRLSYAADWSEYGAHQAGGTELRFPLDPLWASAAVDFIGIDCYLPLTDQRDGPNLYDVDALRAGVTSGEYHDWYYSSPADRAAGLRSPITDGAYARPFVYRAKDLRGWWENPHVERVGGVELASSTAWVPASKPIWLTELGFPAIDKGANQPNVFVDPKSSESAFPHFSSGARDDLIQRRSLEATLSVWETGHPDHAAVPQPISTVYGGQMLEPGRIFLWTWDARPYPAFPLYEDVWSDGENWRLGHWLNGRLGTVSLSGLIRQLIREYDLDPVLYQVADLPGSLEGIAVAGPVSLRQVVEPLLEAFGANGVDAGTHVRFQPRAAAPVSALVEADIVDPHEEESPLVRTRAQASELPSEIRLSAASAAEDYRRRVVASRRLAGGSGLVEALDLGASVAPDLLQGAADARLARIWDGRERLNLALSPHRIDVEPGDRLSLTAVPGQTFEPPLEFLVEAIEDGPARRIEARRTGVARAFTSAVVDDPGIVSPGGEVGPATAVFLDVSPLRDEDPDAPLRLACFAKPWPGGQTLMRSVDGAGYASVLDVERPAVMGRITTDLAAGPIGYLDRASGLEVQLYGGLLQSRSLASVLSGLNALAVRSRSGSFEILQFVEADLVADRLYRLGTLLRGQKGTETEAGLGAEAGADVVLLEPERVPLVPLASDQIGLEYAYRLVPSGASLEEDSVASLTHAASGRGRLPLAPVHLSARREAAGISLRWIRQTRRGGDSWEQEEVPLGEASEAYEVDILGPGDSLLRTLASTAPQVVYTSAQELADFGAPQSSLTFSVVQLSATAGRGHPRKAVLNV
ncbi:baseplate multidomain protein megatron [Roseibium sp.]|uniref:baseplate multidomain protein megatron n=1 Tax=Roseibium sp. TaxID=1936156 RepID=UPI003A974765